MAHTNIKFYLRCSWAEEEQEATLPPILNCLGVGQQTITKSPRKLFLAGAFYWGTFAIVLIVLAIVIYSAIYLQKSYH
jgi:hypothetical protein